MCHQIDSIIELSKQEGNSITNYSSSDKLDKIIWMKEKVSINLRNKLTSDLQGLTHKTVKGEPHQGPVEYFVCYECKTAIVFPIENPT